MVTYSFSTKLSKDYVSFYENGKECADVIIRAGREGSVEEFYAHSFVLLIRSIYFRKELEGVKEKNADNKIIIEKPDINPKLFDKILRYFYGGELEFDEKNSKEMFEFFLITKELNVSELLDVLQNQFLKSPRQIYQNFSTTLQISSSHESFKKLHEFCLKTIESSPEIIFKSEDFHLLDENTLLVLLQNEKLKVEEIEKWEFIIKWGISRTFADTGSSASPPPAAENFKETADVSLWTRDKFRDLSNTLKQFIPLIDFYKIKPEDFYEKVKPFKKIIEKPLFEDILKYHITSTASSPQKDRPEPIFNIRLNSILDLDHFRLFTKWINETTNISSNSDICYNFSLILRGSESGLTAGKFHELCDNKGPTLSIIKIRGSTEIIGGYNPISWDQSLYPDSTYFRTNECFVFKLNKQANKSIIGRPRPGSSGMVGNIPNHGPTFNGALYLKGDFGREYVSICKGNAYTVHIRDTQAPFLVEELEVYQVIKEIHGSNP